MSHLPVLIVGAGPTGLMMATELTRHNIPFRIIDKNSEPTKGSNATWIQARTLEIFEAIGIIDNFLKRGHRCNTINLYNNGKSIANLPLNQIDSIYPFILMLPQRETERLLSKKLYESGITIERSSELINIAQTNHGIVATIKHSKGDTETITSDWVVACDGANSTVREKSHVIFPGEDIPEQFMVADAEMDSFLPTDEIHVFFNKGTIFPEKATIFTAFPWGNKQYRLNANLYHKTPRQTFYEHEVKEVVAERTYGNYIVEKVSWISPYWIHSKIVNNMQNNSIFLLGDAAHIHSPAGGQGMNSGLQDAYNLAWKLASVIKNKTKSSLIDSFQLERHPIDQQIVKKTNSLTNMMLFDKKFFEKLRTFSKKIAQTNYSKKIGSELMQTDICYKNSPIINYNEKPATKSPQQGERAPNVKINDNEHLYKYFFNIDHNILIFSGLNPKNTILDKIIELQKKLNENNSNQINTYVISTASLDIKNLILDINENIHHQYHIKKTAIYIIRPDTYISYFSKKLEMEPIVKFFQTIGIKCNGII